jgi:glutaryl-CoA dehydrogenase (non-decarboxylating)
MTDVSNADLASERTAFRTFVEAQIRPHAERFDHEECVPPALIHCLGREGYLGFTVPERWGGKGKSMTAFGVLNEEVGRGCSSVRSLLTVHSMVSQAILRWGNEPMRSRWLPELASGQTIAAFALSEQNAGSDANGIEATARPVTDGYVLEGQKKWITFGQIAGVFLVFARCDGRHVALLVERNTPGLTVTPVKGLLGLRASMAAELRLENCHVPGDTLVGAPGFGLSHVAATALDLGRYSVAWGSVGIAQDCLTSSLRYANARKQFGSLLKDHQLVRRMLTGMIVNVQAARLLCLEAGRMKDSGDPGSVVQTIIAKYFSSQTAAGAARDAVQIHGASGCTPEHPVARHFRDAKIMEIIEGSDEIHQLTIAEHGCDLEI